MDSAGSSVVDDDVGLLSCGGGSAGPGATWESDGGGRSILCCSVSLAIGCTQVGVMCGKIE